MDVAAHLYQAQRRVEAVHGAALEQARLDGERRGPVTVSAHHDRRLGPGQRRGTEPLDVTQVAKDVGRWRALPERG